MSKFFNIFTILNQISNITLMNYKKKIKEQL